MKLTSVDPGLDRIRAITKPGMAHWASTGPDGTFCYQCKNFSLVEYYSANSKHGDVLKPAPCSQYEKLTGEAGAPIAGNNQSCKYFVENPAPPSLRNPKR